MVTLTADGGVMTYEDHWTPQDINKMSMEEYTRYREHIFNEIGLLTPEEAQKCMEIKKPPKPFHFESF